LRFDWRGSFISLGLEGGREMGDVSGGGVGAAAGALGPLPGGEPVVLGAAAVMLAGAGFLLLLRVRERRAPARRFRAALEARDEVAVLTHPNPDPDALACALAVRELASRAGADVTIHYPGEVQREENLALIRELDIEATRIRDASDLSSRKVVLVDHNQPRGFAGAGGLTPYAVVDHHPGDGEGSAFTDVRPEYGACASLIVEYLQDLGWENEVGPTEDREGEESPDDGEGPPVLSERLATALAFGIRADTRGFTRGCTTAEFDAAAYCSPRANPETIKRVSTPPVDPATMEVRARAVLNREQRGAFLCSHAGEVPSADAVAQAADEILRLEEVTAVVVAGECDNTLYLSGRATEGGVDIGETLSRAIEGIPMSDAGGHARMGGGQLSVDHMEGLGPGDGVSIEQLFESVFAVMASQDPAGAPTDPSEPVDPVVVGSESDEDGAERATDRLEPDGGRLGASRSAGRENDD
jgi:nanoRNase/pAp phosphatase (c-di-AMP/oligoRNAs hydrolase)